MLLHTGMKLPGLSNVYVDTGCPLGVVPIVEMEKLRPNKLSEVTWQSAGTRSRPPESCQQAVPEGPLTQEGAGGRKWGANLPLQSGSAPYALTLSAFNLLQLCQPL